MPVLSRRALSRARVGSRRGCWAEALERRKLLTAVWTGAVNGNWSEPGNWQGGHTAAQDIAVDFPANASNKTNTNDLGPLTLATLAIHGGGYAISSSVTSGQNPVPSVITFNGNGINTLDATSGASNTFNAAVHLNNLGTAVTVAADSTLSFGAAVDGLGTLNKNGTGTMVLPSANPNFGGPFNLNAGTLRVDNAAALGTSGGDTSVTNVTTLELGPGADGGAETIHVGGTGFNNGGALRAAGTLAWAGTVDLNRAGTSIVVPDNDTLTLNKGLTGGDSIAKQGAGTLALAGTSNFGGGTVEQGVLRFQGGAGTGPLTVTSGAAIHLQSGVTVTATGGPTVLNGTGINNSGALQNVSGNNRWNGDLKAGSNTLIFSTAGTLTVGGTIDTSGFTVTGGGPATMEFTGAVTGSGALAKSGAGTMILSGTSANTYAGATTVNAGILSARKSSALGAAVAGTTVASGAALALQGGISISAEALSIAGAGAGTGALVNASDSNTYGGNVTLTGPATIGSASGTLTLTGGINNGGSLLTVTGSGDVVLAGAGVLSGSGGLTKTGTGNLTVGGTAANTYTGATNINVGIVVLQKVAGLGGGAGSTTVASGGALHFDGPATVAERLFINGNGTGGSTPTTFGALEVTGPDVTLTGNVTVSSSASIGTTGGDMVLAGALDGSGTLTKLGNGNLTLSGNNAAYAGRLFVNNGDVTALGANALGVPGSGNVGSTFVQIGAKLTFGPTGAGGDLTLNEALTLAGTLSGFSAANSTSTWAGPVTLSAPATLSPLIDAGAGATGHYTISGVVGGTENWVKTGAGSVTLAGTSSNTYVGTVTVKDGTLLLGKTAGRNAITGDLVIGDDAGSNRVTLLADNQIADAAAVTANGVGTLDLANHNETTGALTLTGGDVTTGSGTLTLGGDVTASALVETTPQQLTFQPSISGRINLGTGAVRTVRVDNVGSTLTLNADVGGAARLAKDGAGTLIFFGNATNAGGVSASHGTTFVNGTTGTTSVDAGVLAGNGTVGSLTANALGIVSPGLALGGPANGAAAILVLGGASFNDQSFLSVDLNGSLPGGTYDQLRVAGPVTLGNDSTRRVGLLLRVLPGFSPAGLTFTLIENEGTGAVVGHFNGLPEGAVTSVGGVAMRISYVGGDGNDVTLAPFGIPNPPPRVTGVSVSGSAWAARFRQFLQAGGLGSAAHGFAVPAGAAQLTDLPWNNINQVSVTFDKDVTVAADDLQLRGVNVASYPVTGVTYDGATHTATWTLARAIANDKVLIDLDGDAGGVSTPGDATNLLDGEYAGTLPSGNGTKGGDFRFQFNVLPGDVQRNNNVNPQDLLAARARQSTSTTIPGTGPNAYNVFADVNGTGNVDARDLFIVRADQFKQLPSTSPTAALSSIRKDLFGTLAIV